MKKLRIVQNKPTVKENSPVSVGLNMDQTDAVYKVLEDNFGEEHMKDMFTLGSLSFYNMMVKGGIAGVFKEGKVNEEEAGEVDKLAAKIQKALNNGDISKQDAAEMRKALNKGDLDVVRKANLNEDKADAARWFGNLKFSYQKGLTSPDLKDPADKTEYKRLAKDFFSKLEVDNKVRPIGEEIDVLNKIADMFDRKYPHLTFDVREPMDRIDVRGDQQDLFKFGTELDGEKIFDYQVSHIEDDDRGEVVRIIKTSDINEEKADRCLRIARREIPQSSAYRSGLIVKCRKGMIWKNKK